jgi:hypothetical protein
MTASNPKPQKKIENRPAWNEHFVETENTYKVSKADLMKKKVQMISKNRLKAKEEWRANQQALKSGKIPDQYKEFVGPKEKIFTAKQAFLENNSVAREYEGRY